MIHRSELKLVPSDIERSHRSTSMVSFSSSAPSREVSLEDVEVGSPPRVAVVHTRVSAPAESGPPLSSHSGSHVGTTSSSTNVGELLRVQPPATMQELELELLSNVDGPTECCLDQPVGQSGVLSPLLRRSTCRTAGQHPNPFHLPQAVAQNGSISIAEVSAFATCFRPWQ